MAAKRAGTETTDETGIPLAYGRTFNRPKEGIRSRKPGQYLLKKRCKSCVNQKELKPSLSNYIVQINQTEGGEQRGRSNNAKGGVRRDDAADIHAAELCGQTHGTSGREESNNSQSESGAVRAEQREADVSPQ